MTVIDSSRALRDAGLKETWDFVWKLHERTAALETAKPAESAASIAELTQRAETAERALAEKTAECERVMQNGLKELQRADANQAAADTLNHLALGTSEPVRLVFGQGKQLCDLLPSLRVAELRAEADTLERLKQAALRNDDLQRIAELRRDAEWIDRVQRQLATEQREKADLERRLAKLATKALAMESELAQLRRNAERWKEVAADGWTMFVPPNMWCFMYQVPSHDATLATVVDAVIAARKAAEPTPKETPPCPRCGGPCFQIDSPGGAFTACELCGTKPSGCPKCNRPQWISCMRNCLCGYRWPREPTP